jgi:hypothetical protein
MSFDAAARQMRPSPACGGGLGERVYPRWDSPQEERTLTRAYGATFSRRRER